MTFIALYYRTKGAYNVIMDIIVGKVIGSWFVYLSQIILFVNI